MPLIALFLPATAIALLLPATTILLPATAIALLLPATTLLLPATAIVLLPIASLLLPIAILLLPSAIVRNRRLNALEVCTHTNLPRFVQRPACMHRLALARWI